MKRLNSLSFFFFWRKFNSLSDIQKKKRDLIWCWRRFAPARCASLIIDWWPQSRINCARSSYCLFQLDFLLWVKQEHMSKVPFSTPIAFNKVIHLRDPMPSVEQHAQKDREPYTEETQADNPYHNEAFPKSKMPKKAHKPPNVPACKNSHLPIIEVFPTARSPRKPNPTYILPTRNAPKFSQGIVVPRIQHFTSNCEPVFLCKRRDKCDDHVWNSTTRLQLFIVLSRHPPTPWNQS